MQIWQCQGISLYDMPLSKKKKKKNHIVSITTNPIRKVFTTGMLSSSQQQNVFQDFNIFT